jgi:membrane fusion protein (multidrug efflux system)
MMKKPVLAVVLVVAVFAVAALLWWRSSGSGEGDAAAPTEVAVHVAKITRATLRARVTAYGVVEPEPPGERSVAGARISPATPGVVTSVECVEGRRVKKGEILFRLDSRAADVAAEKARRAVEFAETTLERQRKLIEVEGTSRRQLLEAEQAVSGARAELAAAETQQALLRVEAPMAGTVARIAAKPGDGVDLATTLVELVNLDRLVVSAGVPAAELPRLQVGQPAEVEGDGLPAPVEGKVVSIRPEVDPKTGTALVRVGVKAGSGLRPGQLVSVRIVSEERRDRLAVPVESVTKNAEGETVVAVVDGTTAVQKPVKAGLRDGDLVEVEGDGLQEGQTVVTLGAYALPRETKIRVLGP